ncbi:hypothetical protein SAMN05216420_102310 [Nitrosospira sp. Nl5]|uniref:right-handed parallel beta-helix repeat-containing protein n=1 Tax=Nitrosospira sp. Nl5 TaxID=200120 RepID=UPI0008826DAD|nr:right-handed parallel beta-helix repeat-containing protein [Nitrosospira sp. Nl5]SCY10365.1 hypothetical protein SAMN05216420_102310 [Nitrosospira sp. Nl5]
MKGRITRDHDARQNYDGVYFEGGSAVTDADLNAGFDAQRNQTETLHKAWIAPAGSPDDGWKATNLRTVNDGGQDFVDFDLESGHYGLDGNILKNPASYSYFDQPYAQSASLTDLDRLPMPTLAEVTAAPGKELFDAVILDAIKVPVRVNEDSELDEVAIRSDPATRTKFSPKIRTMRDVPGTCAEARSLVLDALATPNGSIGAPSPKFNSGARLRVHLGAVPSPDNPCAPVLATGYFGRLNHTIKVMLADEEQFVWSFHNAEGLSRATLVDPTTLRLMTPFDDSSLFPVAGQIVELCPWDMELPNGEMTAVPLGQFHAINKGYDPHNEMIVLDTPVATDLQDWYDARLAAGDAPFLFLRFWQPASVPMATSDAIGLNIPLAHTGVFLNFLTPGMPSDQWTFSVRVNANDTVFPKRMLELQGQPPMGLERYADLIGLIHWTIDSGQVAGHLHDCRRRIRPLWQQQDCCTFKVGDGVASFGDFNSIHEAITSLPHKGGKICLLPGRHQGGTELRNRESVVIEGCGRQSVIVQHPSETPLFTIEDCVDVRLKDIYFEDGQVLAIAGARNRGLEILGVRTHGRGSAIALVRNQGLRVNDCRFFAEAEPAIIPAADFPTLRPLAFFGGSTLEIRNNGFICEASDLSLQSLGGVQIASNSDHVWFENNVISGGLGHGLTLGNLIRVDVQGLRYGDIEILQSSLGEMAIAAESNAVWQRNGRTSAFTADDMAGAAITLADRDEILNNLGDAAFQLNENPFGILNIAIQGCIAIDPSPTLPDPGEDDEDWEVYFVAGEVSHIHIVDNEFANLGGSGISSLVWNLSTRAQFGTMVVRELIVDRNHIHNCCLVAIATTLEADEIQEIGFGGIALEYVAGGKVSNNLIENIGLEVRTPSSGIHFREIVHAHIHDNVIRAIGRVERRENLNISGIAGGIIIDQCWPEYGNPTVLPGAGVGVPIGHTKMDAALTRGRFLRAAKSETRLPRGESLRIQNNSVMVNFGMSLDVRGSGSMHIADNHFTGLSYRFNPARARLAINVSVVNTELPGIELITAFIALLDLLAEFGIGGFTSKNFSYTELLLLYAALLIYYLSLNKFFDIIQFQNNQTYYENFDTSNDVISLNAVISPYDVQISNNAMKSLHADFGAWYHLLSAGYYSHQGFANRFETRPINGVFRAALTIGVGNSTYLNHASQSIDTVKLVSVSFSGDGNLTP